MNTATSLSGLRIPILKGKQFFKCSPLFRRPGSRTAAKRKWVESPEETVRFDRRFEKHESPFQAIAFHPKIYRGEEFCHFDGGAGGIHGLGNVVVSNDTQGSLF